MDESSGLPLSESMGDMSKRNDRKGGFKCAHCHRFVSTESVISGVQNRNHCPYCLWSRHVDLRTAGDRLAACGAGMRPIGLTLKKTYKKYGPAGMGELMLIHLCAGCEKLSINRIAADDDAEELWRVFQASFALEAQLRARLEGDGIRILQAEDAPVVRAQLFGRDV